MQKKITTEPQRHREFNTLSIKFQIISKEIYCKVNFSVTLWLCGEKTVLFFGEERLDPVGDEAGALGFRREQQ